jgi:hypothetical protein
LHTRSNAAAAFSALLSWLMWMSQGALDANRNLS